jgi:hypothetical protein
MKTKNLILGCALLFGALQTQNIVAQDNLKDLVVVDGNYVFYYEDNMDASFYKAMADFLNFDRKAASEEIAKAEGYVWYFENASPEKDKPALRKVAMDLYKLSKKLEKDTIVYFSDLQKGFTETHHALASYHYGRATELWAKKETQKAGQEMELAAKHMAHAASWTGNEIAEGSRETWKATRTAARGMAYGTAVSVEATGKALAYLGEELKKLGEKMKPTPKATATKK